MKIFSQLCLSISISLIAYFAKFAFAIHNTKYNYKWDIQSWFGGVETDAAMIVDQFDDVYLLGSKFVLGSGVYFVQKVSGNGGRKLWERSWPMNAQKAPKGLCSDNYDAVFIVGSTNVSLYAPITNRSVDIYYEKWNGTDGTQLWGYQLGTDGRDEAWTCLVIETGQTYIAGTTSANLFGADTLGDAFFVSEINATDGAVQWGYQEAASNIILRHNSVATTLRTDRQGHIYVAGRTQGLYGTNRDGGDVFALKFNVTDPGVTRVWWKQQYDIGTSADWIGGCDVDTLGDLYIIGFNIIKVSRFTGEVMWQRVATEDSGQYTFTSLAVINELVFVTGHYKLAVSTTLDPPTSDMVIGFIGMDSESGKIKWLRTEDGPGNQKGLQMTANLRTGNKYIVGTTDHNVSMTPGTYPIGLDVRTDTKLWKLKIFDDPPPLITYGYRVQSPMVITVLFFLCFTPVALLAIFSHRDSSIPFFFALRRIILPVLDLITDVLFLLTAEFFSVELYRLFLVDMFFICFLPVLFYEWAVYKNATDYQRAVSAGGRYTPFLDVFCICSVDAKNLFKDYEANEVWPCDAGGRRCPHPCNVIWTACVTVVAFVIASLDLIVKFFFYEFKLLNYLFKSQHRYVKENQYLNQRAQNYEILAHVVTQSLVMLIIQGVNGSLLREGYTNIALLSMAVSGANITMAIYWYVLRYWLYLAQGSVLSFTNLSKVAIVDDYDVDGLEL
jgi:hypothetical protein